MVSKKLMLGLTLFALAACPAFAVGTWGYNAQQVGTPPTIDGVVNAAEYPTDALVLNAATMAANGGTKLKDLDSNQPGVTNDTDLSGTFYIVWDATYLYIAAKVTDDEVLYLLDAPNALNATDGIQFCIDHRLAQTAGDTAAIDNDGFFIHDLVPGQASANNTPAYFQHWPDKSPLTRTLFPNTIIGGRTVAGGYEVEMAIKWSDFTPTVPTPAAGVQMGYMAMIMEFETVESTQKLADLWWNAGNKSNIIANPSGWNVMTLDADWDNDGLTNTVESTVGTALNKADTDEDGLSDAQEVGYDGNAAAYTPGADTDPLIADTDGDGFSDGMEVNGGFNPLDQNDFPTSVPAMQTIGLAALMLLMMATAAGALALRRGSVRS